MSQTVESKRLVAVLRKRRDPHAKASYYDVVAEVPVYEKRSPGCLSLIARHYLGVTEPDALHVWEVTRLDGSLFERRRVRSYVLEPDPEHERKSDAACDWPCSARYAIHGSAAWLDPLIDDPTVSRDPETGLFRSEAHA